MDLVFAPLPLWIIDQLTILQLCLKLSFILTFIRGWYCGISIRGLYYGTEWYTTPKLTDRRRNNSDENTPPHTHNSWSQVEKSCRQTVSFPLIDRRLDKQGWTCCCYLHMKNRPELSLSLSPPVPQLSVLPDQEELSCRTCASTYLSAVLASPSGHAPAKHAAMHENGHPFVVCTYALGRMWLHSTTWSRVYPPVRRLLKHTGLTSDCRNILFILGVYNT